MKRSPLREDAEEIIGSAIRAVLPDAAVRRALAGQTLEKGRVVLIAVGKAAWQMANSAAQLLGDRIDEGLVVTKHGHSRGPIRDFRIIEAGHPVPDENSYLGAQTALELVDPLGQEDHVLFLLSGGGPALFELPLLPAEELEDLTQQLLASGANVVEINTLRKRLSGVKGGRFAQRCAPAQVFNIILSDVIGDPVDMIASGPTSPDSSTSAQALEIAERYALRLSPQARRLLEQETPKALEHVQTQITGSVRELCAAAAEACRERGYTPVYLTDRLSCEAREAGVFLSEIARSHAEDGISLAYIAGGETVVHLKGDGLGGRNQELALAAAEGLRGLEQAAVFSVGSDGTDGPTDAAGGYVDGSTARQLDALGEGVDSYLARNDAYHALAKTDGLIVTGPTGTNVNDVAVVLIRSGAARR
mgnify:CR=1 FL=1